MSLKTLYPGLVCGIGLALAPGGAFGQRTPSAPSQATPPTLAEQNSANSMDSTMSSQKVDDKKFVKEAALGGMTEVELGKLAAQKASSDDVKQFAQKMVDDHSKANEQLKMIAARENIEVPSSLDSKHQAEIDKLQKLSGEQFDKAYVKDQVKDHETDVQKFQAEANNGSDNGVKTFAANTLPTVKEHLDMVKSIQKIEHGGGGNKTKTGM